MPESVNVPVTQGDYKSAVTKEKVSVRNLRGMITALESEVRSLSEMVDYIKLELNAIIEEIGEDW